MDHLARLDELARLRHVIETQRLLNEAALSTVDLMRIVTERAQALTGADGGVVELTDGDHLVYQAASGAASAFFDMRLPRSGSLSGRCVMDGRPLTCDDADTDARVDRDACLAIGVRSMIVVPLFKEDVAVGALKVFSGRSHHFHEGDIETLEMMAGFISVSLANADQHEREARRALHDPLTGLANRVLLMDRLDQALVQARRHGGHIAVFFIDLDGFKAVNDQFGHASGDALLKDVARVLRGVVREGDTVSRFGGDEFVILCPKASEAVTRLLPDRIATAMDALRWASVDYSGVGASVGWAVTEAADTDADELLAAADAGMYRAKMARRAE